MKTYIDVSIFFDCIFHMEGFESQLSTSVPFAYLIGQLLSHTCQFWFEWSNQYGGWDRKCISALTFYV